MPDRLLTALIESGPLGILVACVFIFVVPGFVWVVKKCFDLLDERDRIREQHTKELLEAAHREKEEVRASAKLAGDIKSSLETNTAAIHAVLQTVGR